MYKEYRKDAITVCKFLIPRLRLSLNFLGYQRTLKTPVVYSVYLITPPISKAALDNLLPACNLSTCVIRNWVTPPQTAPSKAAFLFYSLVRYFICLNDTENCLNANFACVCCF